MRVLYLTPGVFDKGGISRYNRHQITALRELLGQTKVTVVSLLGPSNSARDLEAPFSVDWMGERAEAGKAGEARFAAALFRYAVRLKPTLIWSAHMYYSALAHSLARWVGARSVVQVYGREAWTPRPSRPDILWGLRRCDYVTSDSHFTAEYLERTFRQGRQVAVFWDPVDTERFAPASPDPAVLTRYGIPRPGSSFTILTLGRLSAGAAYKGYERLLEVFARLPGQATLVFAGGGDLVQRLKDRAAALGEDQRVVFTGFVDDAHLPDVYRSASVFCLIGDRGPTRGEGIPLTPLEAAACGTPILVGNQDGSREAVEHGVTGMALDPFDLDGITAALTDLMSDETQRTRLGRNGRLRVEREHAYPVFRSRIEHFLAELDAPVRPTE